MTDGARTVELAAFDDRSVRITLSDGAVFDGLCRYDCAEYCLHEFGREEDALEIDGWLFYAGEIASVSVLSEPPRLWMGKPMHRMRLNPEPFAMIEIGQKTIELRLFDEKRRAIRSGDVIRFANTADEDEVLYCRADKLHVFPSFADLYEALPLTACGYSPEAAKTASPKDMDAYYSAEEQRRFGVVGISVIPL